MSEPQWISTLPNPLKQKVKSLIAKDSNNLEIFNNLFEYLSDQFDTKRRKVDQPPEPQQPPPQEQTVEENGSNLAIPNESIIFEIEQISFQSPVRKRMNLTIHLIEQDGNPQPIISIVNPTTLIPEVSIMNLSQTIKLCMILPILGNSTTPLKKGIVLLCFWMNQPDMDPIICQLNLDIIKKQMIKLGKLPANIESQFTIDKNSLVLNPIQDRIIDYFKRQFKLCGINLINYLPCEIFQNKFTLNHDNAIALSVTNIPSLIMVECHRGAKEGILLVNPSYLIFGFKKPILIYQLSQIKQVSYTSITRVTFSVVFIVINDRNEERTLEFSMIDQRFFQIIDDFIKLNNIKDDSYNEELKEKPDTNKPESQVATDTGSTGAPPPTTGEDSEEEDEDFQEGEEGESEVDEEYDSDAGAHSDNNNDEDDDVFNKGQEEEEGDNEQE
ncbi:Histone chaperone [Spathaspora sp. JA1]|nr:Histone chaperone [Spathaspora sp. JA1]